MSFKKLFAGKRTDLTPFSATSPRRQKARASIPVYVL
jgi:hypothetical protein